MKVDCRKYFLAVGIPFLIAGILFASTGTTLYCQTNNVDAGTDFNIQSTVTGKLNL